MTVTKVDGEEETTKTKEYRVPVNSLDNSFKHSIKAIGNPSISDDIQ